MREPPATYIITFILVILTMSVSSCNRYVQAGTSSVAKRHELHEADQGDLDMTVRVDLEFHGATHPTSDGKQLKIGNGEIVGDFGLTFHVKEESDDLPTDVVQASFRIADNTGQLWEWTTQFTAEAFVSHMLDFSYIENGLFYIDSAPSEITDYFKNNLLLEGVRFSSDDRFIRILHIEDDKYETQFKYTTMTFDVAGYESSRLLVKVKECSLWTYDEGDEIRDFGYVLSIHHLLRLNTAVYSEDYDCWMDSPIPLPNNFRPLNEKGTPQESVTVIEK